MKTPAYILLVLFFILISVKSFSQSNTKINSESKSKTGLTKKATPVEVKAKSDKIDSEKEQQNNVDTKANDNPVSKGSNAAVSNLKSTHRASKKMANSNFNKK